MCRLSVPATESSSRALLRAADAISAGSRCTRIVATAGGSSGTRSTAHRPVTSVSRTRIRVSMRIPPDADEEALVMLSDILPTGFECGVLNGQVHPGDTVAIVGAGPVGLAALLTAQFYSPAAIVMVDLDDKRLEVARQLGATTLINSTDGQRGTTSDGPDGGSRRRCGHRSRRRTRHLRHLSGDSRAGRAARERWCSRRPGGPAPREVVGSQRHDYNAPGRHDDHADAAEGRAIGTAPGAATGDTSLRAWTTSCRRTTRSNTRRGRAR